MEESTYLKIINALDEKIKTCRDNFGTIATKEDILQLSLADARRLRELAKVEVEDMTEIVMVELYHLIAMGNLTVFQMSSFLRKLKEYLKFRPVIKDLSTSLKDLEDIPQLPSTRRFQLKHLGNIYLTVGDEKYKAVEVVASVQDYKGNKDEEIKKTNISFSLEGNKLSIHKSHLKALSENYQLFGLGCNLDLEILKKKIDHNGTYGGIQWLGITVDGIVEGIVRVSGLLDKFKHVLDVKNS